MERWHQFKDSIDHRPTPYFRLPSGTGGSVGLSDQRGRHNLVLLFLEEAEEARLRQVLERFAAARIRYDREDSKVLFILPVDERRVEALTSSLSPAYPLLADPGGEVRQRYATLLTDDNEHEGALIFVLDRFRGCFAALRTPDPAAPALQDEILEWLSFIELQCPE
ncbi:MAG: peroxiredoxin family protein [Chloroflexota bacterium]|nr:peroxiredoxin family protein [Chloroflexota bacterium]